MTQYREFQPHPALAPYVRCYWVLEDVRDAEVVDCISPDGCAEMIVHWGDRFAQLDDAGQFALQPAALFAGQLTRVLRLRAGRQVGVIGVRFQPAGARPLLGLPQNELLNCRVPLDAVLPRQAANRWLEQVVEAGSVAGRLAVIERELLTAAQAAPDPDPVAALAARRLANPNTEPVSDLARRLMISPRQLERRFQAGVGLTPKVFARIERFKALQQHVRCRPASTWAQAAARFNYTDQSHLVRDFHQFTGTTPSTWIQSACAVEGWFRAP